MPSLFFSLFLTTMAPEFDLSSPLQFIFFCPFDLVLLSPSDMWSSFLVGLSPSSSDNNWDKLATYSIRSWSMSWSESIVSLAFGEFSWSFLLGSSESLNPLVSPLLFVCDGAPVDSVFRVTEQFLLDPGVMSSFFAPLPLTAFVCRRVVY